MKLSAAMRRRCLDLAGVPTPTRRRLRSRPLAEPAIALEVLLPLVTGSESNLRHWRARSRRTQQARLAWSTVVAMFGLAGVRLPLPVQVTLTRRGGRQLDDDNLRPALKAVRDAVAEWLGIDDGDDRAATWSYGQEPGGASGVLVRIETIAADPIP